MKPVAHLSVAIQPSRRLLVIQLAAHLAVATAVLASNVPSWVAVLLLILVGASLARVRGKLAVTGLVLRGDGELETVGADGTPSAATVHPHTLVVSFLVVLLYRQQGRSRSLTLLSDSLAAEDFRQLRLWLRWRAGVQQAA